MKKQLLTGLLGLFLLHGYAARAADVVSFTLIDISTNAPMAGYDPIPAGATITLTASQTVNIRANTNGTVGSVKFVLSGAAARTQIESVAPYALFADTNGVYNPWTPPLGSYTLTGQSFTGSGAGGTPGTLYTLNFSVARPATSQTYYISPTGSDSNSGTSSSTPWQTIAKVNSSSFAAGDQILFQGGQTFAGNLAFGSDDTGTATSPITVGSYGTGLATLDGGSSTAIQVHNTAGFVIHNLIVKGGWDATAQAGNNGVGVGFLNDLPGATKLNFVQVDNVEAYGFEWVGIEIKGSASDGTKSGFTNVEITNCYVHDNGYAGISSGGPFSSSATTYSHANINVRRCTVANNKGIIPSIYSSHSGEGVILGDVDGATIERCVAHDNGGKGVGSVALWTWDSNAVTIQFNEAYNQKSSNFEDGDGFDLDGGVTNSVVQYNYSHNNYGAGYLVYQFSGARPSLSGNTIRYNISENDARHNDSSHLYGGIALSATSSGTAIKNNNIYNNTVFVNATGVTGTTSAFRVGLALGVNNNVRNNIFVSSGGVRLLTVASGSNLVFQRNDYWPSGGAFALYWAGTVYTSLSQWTTAATTQERDASNNIIALNVDPLLTAPGSGGTIGNPDLLATNLTAYKLTSTSPMIDAALNLSTQFGVNPGSQDFYGTPLDPATTVFDIGAHETGETWLDSDIGAVGVAGSSSYDSSTGTFTVQGSGTDIFGTADSFHFVRSGVKFSGNKTIIARVVSVQNTNSTAKSGIMLRETTGADSREVMMAITPTQGGRFLYRASTGGTTTSSTISGLAGPCLIKIVRSGATGNVFTASYWNGTAWVQAGQATVSMTGDLEVGLATCAHNNTVLCTAVFDSVSITP